MKFEVGNKPWNTGKHVSLSPRTQFTSESIKGGKNPFYGKHHTQASKLKISAAKMGKSVNAGEKNASWCGGVSKTRPCYRGDTWKKDRLEILERDQFVCRKCGKEVDLDVHHIIPYRISKDNRPENLISLCSSCHIKLDRKYMKYGLTQYEKKFIEENKAIDKGTDILVVKV